MVCKGGPPQICRANNKPNVHAPDASPHASKSSTLPERSPPSGKRASRSWMPVATSAGARVLAEPSIALMRDRSFFSVSGFTGLIVY